MIDVEDLKNGFRIGEWRVQPRLGTMSREDKIEYPSRNALRVLLILASSQGRFVSRAELVESIWEDPALGNVPLNRCMHELAAVFEDPSYVRNVPGRGYRVGQSVVLEPEEVVEKTRNWPVVVLGGMIIGLLAVIAWAISA